ncbi:MAG: hypothetical protein NXH81_04310 [Halieaceae bacterium]|jgi:hypothetical protein|uniref:hypothetical protein n=1 Tax=Haliea alexandrii TaxID=2448162 RepID=UPI0018EE5BCB|nr:hypothetical protein [Haliea alexandrii]MCR9184602.1 hypothetical protein [Halieaceae bacterium]
MLKNPWYLSLLSLVAVLLIIAVLAWLTTEPEPDPCSALNQDVGAAVLADESGDQDALVNRAIIQRGDCEPAQ